MKSDKNTFELFFCKKIHDFHVSKKLTQERMSELLGVVPRSYVDLEQGRSCPSGWTTLHFLAAQSDQDILQFMDEFRDEVRKTKCE